MNQAVIHSYTGKLSAPPWRILLIGLGLALFVAAVVMVVMMRPPVEDVATLILTLTLTSVLSLGLGYFLYRNGWTRSPSLRMTLIFTCSWGAVLTFANMWVMAQLMFASDHDLALSVVLLLFTAIIATAYGVFVAASVTDGLRQVAGTARQVAAGDLTARAHVPGRDEVAQLAQAFNEMAAQLQRAAAHREELEVLRRDLIAWTSHDLRTPLTGIRAMVEALHDQVVTDPATVRRYYQSIRADVLALNHLIDDLFELAQLDAGGLVLEKSPHSLGDLISDALESFRLLAAERGIELSGQIGPEL
ncbi:MAG: HAMP domain-containing protein, partial [Chloroflexota bacterium]